MTITTYGLRAVRLAVRDDASEVGRGRPADSYKGLVSDYGSEAGQFYRFVRNRGLFEQLGATEKSIQDLYDVFRARKERTRSRAGNGRFVGTRALENWS